MRKINVFTTLMFLVLFITTIGCALFSNQEALNGLVTSESSRTPPQMTATVLPSAQAATPLNNATSTPSVTDSEVEGKPTPTVKPSSTIEPITEVMHGWLVFARKGISINIIRTDGYGLKTIVDQIIHPVTPKWSPDGRWIAFIGEGPGSYTDIIYLVRPDGSETKWLASSKGIINDFSWAPDGNSIVFSQTAEIGGEAIADIFVYNLTTSQIQQLTDTPELQEFSPEYTPTGEDIVFFTIDREHTITDMIMSNNGTNVRPFLFPMNYNDIRWFKNGSLVAVIYGEKLQTGFICGDLYLVTSANKGVTRLTDTSQHEFSPSWSPNGKMIAYTQASCNESGFTGFATIFTINVETREVKKVTGEEQGDVQWVDWSPFQALAIGEEYKVTNLGANLNLRELPSLRGNIIRILTEGDKIQVIDEPREEAGYLWWHVYLETYDQEGWIVEMPGWFNPDS